MEGDSARAGRLVRRLFPTCMARRLLALAALAAAAPIAALAALLALAEAPSTLAFAIAGGAAVGSLAALLLLRAALRPLDAVAETAARLAPPRPDEDETATLARALDALSRRLHAATRREDPARLDDPLTGLPNRLSVMRRGRDEITRARRKGEPLCAALFAVEDYEGFAAAAGADEAESALRAIAEIAAQTLRAYDTVGRWDATRFVALLPEAEIEHAVGAMRRVRGAVAEADLGRRAGVALAISAGVAVMQPDDATLADIAGRAALALDRAMSRPGAGVEAAPGPRTRPSFLTSV